MQSVTASSHPTLSYTDSLAASTSDTLLLIARILWAGSSCAAAWAS
jgi:hypothetical protein